MSIVKEKVCIIGSGNWGSVIAKIIGHNVLKSINKEIFHEKVTMWVYEEYINGQPLTDIINNTHENIKYMPGLKIPENVLAIPDLIKAVDEATILVFVIPHQFISNICKQISGKISKSAQAVSLVKGLDVNLKGMQLVSQMISKELKIPVSVLMGANLASEVAKEMFCESTLGCQSDSVMLTKLFHTDYFRISCVPDVAGVEICGAIKNIIALGAGFIDGLEYGDNTKAAIIRIGLLEMKKFAQKFYSGVMQETFFESCGIADLITTCYGGRNRKIAEAMVRTKKPLDVLEAELLNGQKLQGTLAAKEIYLVLEANSLLNEFPLLTTIYRISFENLDPTYIIKNI